MNESLLHIGDSVLSYRNGGSGEAVVLVHGFAEDGNIWNGIEQHLEQEFNVIVPDHVGSGKSKGNTAGITMEKMADDIKAILDRENIGSCTMIGHSMGGYVTLAFAEKYPEKLSRFGLFHSSAFADSDEKKENRRKNIDFIKKHGTAKYLEQSVPKLFSPLTNEKNKALVTSIIDRYSNFSPDSLVHYSEAMIMRPDRTDILKNFDKPILFILGEFDSNIPLEQGLEQCKMPGNSYIYICTLSGHMGMLEEPAFSLESIRYFLSGK
jgi:pimeloyl-ACP methyl ester carboxylesterase